ncbi:MAG: choice-of-anchor B family protein [Bacteroidia bacterium]
MKKASLIWLLFFIAISSKAQFDHQNINLLDSFNDPAVTAEPVYGIRYQSCYGWANPADGKEYGIIGSTSGTYILDVTDPTQIIQRDYVAGRHTDCIWHEYKVYDHYLYIISDDAGNNSLQIADLSYLPDSVHVVYDGTSIFTHAHTLYIEGSFLYVASVSTGSNYSTMNVYSLSNPASPQLLRRLDQDYPAINQVHDMYVVHDTVYASCGYDGLHIYKFNETTFHFSEIGNLTTYPDQGYNHSSFLSKDHSTLYMCDEVPSGLAVKVVDVTDIANPTTVHTFTSNVGVTPHNPYVKGDLLFLANYQDGLYVYDISTPSMPVQEGYFDTHPQNPAGTYPNPAYAGAWAAYADLPSGTILVSDMQYGLFTLDIGTILSTKNSIPAEQTVSVFPNPARESAKIVIPGVANETGRIEILDISGRIIYNEQAEIRSHNVRVNLHELQQGIYLVKFTGEKYQFSSRICVE